MKTFKSFVIALFLLMTASRTAHGSTISWFDGKPGTTSTACIYTGADFSSGTTIPPTINTVTVSATPVAAHAVVTGGGRYVQGTTGVLVTVSTTNDCYEFTGWKIGTKVVDTDSSIDLNVSSNI